MYGVLTDCDKYVCVGVCVCVLRHVFGYIGACVS